MATATRTRTDIALVAHLVRRAAFGAPAWQLEQMASRPYEELVDDFLKVERFQRPEEDLLERYHQEHADEESYRWPAKRWLYRMINSPRPLEEKVALFWHNRFATAASKVTNARMMNAHLNLLRDYGLGNFRTLLQRLSRDPAMIWWLDQQTNHDQDTNENYGRELLELFAMGRGNYSEVDVRSSARAFSGWTIDQTLPRYPNGWYDTNFVYREEDHDHGVKEFLGESGDFNGDDIIDIVVKQEATARFVASNLHRYFVSDTPDEAAIRRLMQAYFDSGYEIRQVLRVLFNSAFFKEARFKRVRWPAEIAVGAMKLTGQHTDPHEFGLEVLVDSCSAMGQELLNPPTVEGWHTGREWIDSGYLIERVNFTAERLGDSKAPGVARIIERVSARRSPATGNDLIDACLYEMGLLEINAGTRKAIADELGAGPFQAGPGLGEKVVFTLQLIGSSREYQLG